MSTSLSAPPAVSTPSGNALRLVLFGLPGAGKSSLLGALAQQSTPPRAETNPFTSFSDGLQQLRQVVYSASPPKTEDEVVAHTLTFQDGPKEEPKPVVLVDCNGEGVEKLLAHSRLEEVPADSALEDAVREADGLILPVDAAAGPERLEKDFEAFGQFLHYLEQRRGRFAEVSGLPVFLVLTKCDRLANPGDSLVDWMDHVEQRKREVDARFRDFLARQSGPEGTIPFGRIELHIWATAVKRPALARTPARPEPFGVAELFRQSLEKADTYQQRRLQASRRLFWTAGSAAVMVTLMLSMTVGLAVYNQDTPRSELLARIEDYRLADRPTAADRLRVPTAALRQKLERLKQFQDNPDFSKLPTEDQQYVRDRQDEIQAYLDYLEKILGTRRPADLTTVEELRGLRRQLRKELAPRDEWAGTVAGELHKDLVAELDRLQAAIDELRRWYRHNGDSARALANFEDNRLPGPAWYVEVKGLFEQTRQVPLLDHELLLGSQTLTSAALLAFDQVTKDRDYWERMRRQLVRVRNVLAALGLIGPVQDPPAVLVIGDGFDLKDAPLLVARLRQAYPNFAADFVPESLPEKVRPDVARIARDYYQALLTPALALVRRKQQEAGWGGLRDWLKNPAELVDFAVLSRTLAQLFDHPEPVDPVVALREFLEKRQFTIYPATFTLEVPEEFRERLPANSSLTITHIPAEGERQTLVYRLDDDRSGRDEGSRAYRYVFVRRSGSKIVYVPGDGLRASLPLLGGEMLSWIDQRSPRYQFERLTLPPRWHRADQAATDGSVEERIRLRAPQGEEGVPRVPDLLPRTTGD